MTATVPRGRRRTHTGWPVGHAYVCCGQPGGELVSSGIWHLGDPARFDAFRQATEATSFACRRGLPGQILETGRPGWLSDLPADNPQSPRARAATDVGIGAGFAFPVLVGT